MGEMKSPSLPGEYIRVSSFGQRCFRYRSPIHVYFSFYTFTSTICSVEESESRKRMSAKVIAITKEQVGQRIDNFLLRELKGLPKSRIYRAIRKGEVRVNKKRVKAEYRVQDGDQVRIPPLHIKAATVPRKPSPELADMLENQIILEDKDLIIINKPSGLPVHGGTEISAGLIEMLRQMRPKCRYLELVHRLDRETSGCLLVAKKRSVLVELHRLLTNRQVKKQYLLLVKGRLPKGIKRITEPLLRSCLQSGERMVKTSPEGKSAVTVFSAIRYYPQTTLVLATPITGRTHQIRVHAVSMGYPIVGDNKYGDRAFNKLMRLKGLKRLFLHSASIGCDLQDKKIALCALLPQDLFQFLYRLNKEMN